MGRLIETSNIRVKPQYMQDVMGIAMIRCEDLARILADAPTVEAIPKADYENCLKADMVAMLTEIQLEIEEKEQYYQDKFLEGKNAVHDAAMGGRMFGCGECKEVIQQKITSLKGENQE